MPRKLNEWTIMCFNGTDNELALFNVTQLKALKEAGFQKDVEVLAYFDSNENGVPTRLFNMNSKLKGHRFPTKIGDGADPWVRNFVLDEIRLGRLGRKPGRCTKKLADALKKSNEMNVSESLENFLGYCVENHPAKHYLLFCMGHGQIVANDTFLFDENPRSGVTLERLGQIMRDFTNKIRRHGVFELMCLHSCSMSAIEVAYELKGTARYMIASEGYSYVGAWPYRQLLKKIFNTTEHHNLDEARVQELVQRIYELSLYNATDFAFCGYSHDLTLCSLAEDKLTSLVEALHPLIQKLKRAVDKRSGCQDLILLAHLKSQAFWRDDYSDIYDFCRCLMERCNRDDSFQRRLAADCDNVIKLLEQQNDPFDGLVVFSDNFGWEYQYAHGLSIYFPWTPPVGNVQAGRLRKYQKYAFTEALGDDSWFSFLEKYWNETMRPQENAGQARYFSSIMQSRSLSPTYESIINQPKGVLDNKTGGRVNQPAGGPCICPSLKNYPFIMKLHRRRIKVKREWTMTPRVEGAFKEEPKQQGYEEED